MHKYCEEKGNKALVGKDDLLPHYLMISSGAAFNAMSTDETHAEDDTQAPNTVLSKEHVNWRSRDQYVRHFVENVNQVFWIVDAITERIVYISPANEEIWGRDSKFVTTQQEWLQAIHPDDRDKMVLLSGPTFRKRDETYRILRPDGEVRWIRDRSYPVFDKNGKIYRLVGIAEDVTGSKRHQQQWAVLSKLGQKLNTATTSVEAGNIIVEAADELFAWDAATLDLYDVDTDLITSVLTIDTIDGKRVSCQPVLSRGTPSQRARSILTSGAQLILRKENEFPDKAARMFGDKSKPSRSLMLVPIRNGARTVGILSVQSYRMNAYCTTDLGLLQFLADYCAGALNRIRAEQERREAEQRLAEQAALLDVTPDAIIVNNLDGGIIYWNKGAERMFGWSKVEAFGKKAIEMHKDRLKYAEIVEAALKSGEWSGELTKLAKDGREIIVQARGTLLLDSDHRPKAFLIINADITQQKLLEAQMLRAQRMESIGTLAGGIAHDLNNVLAPILMGVQLLRDTAKTPKEHALLDTLQKSSQRGADLVRQVLTFARGVEGKRAAVNVRHLTKEIEKVVHDTFPKNIQFEVRSRNDLWTIEADPTHLHQVLMNLCVNARDAMPSGGKLTVHLSNTMVDEGYARMHPDSVAGPHVLISVEDTGTGMRPEIQDKIFDPFFTTKEVGKGTGLGLSTVLTIVKGHRGFVNVYSEVGHGSKFKVYFPANPTRESAAEMVAEQNSLPHGNGQLVLIIDDEENIRMIGKETLECFGYRAIVAANGAEAVALYAQKKHEIAVVLTDMMMPVMDGPATVVALKSINPDVKVIGSSGLAANEGASRTAIAGMKAFVPKPYTAEKLLKTLRDVLEGNCC